MHSFKAILLIFAPSRFQGTTSYQNYKIFEGNLFLPKRLETSSVTVNISCNT